MKKVLVFLCASLFFASCENGTSARGQKDTLTNQKAGTPKEEQTPGTTGRDSGSRDTAMKTPSAKGM